MLKRLLFILMILPQLVSAFSWSDLWFNKNQQGSHLLKQHNNAQAAKTFTDSNWKGVAYYNNKQYQEAYNAFKQDNSAQGLYNQANALANMQKYKEALDTYTKALAKEKNFSDAQYNYDLVKKLLEQQQQSKNDKSDHNNESQDKQQNDKQDNSKDSQPQHKNNKHEAPNKPQQSDSKNQQSKQNNTQQQNSSSSQDQSKNSNQKNQQQNQAEDKQNSVQQSNSKQQDNQNQIKYNNDATKQQTNNNSKGNQKPESVQNSKPNNQEDLKTNPHTQSGVNTAQSPEQTYEEQQVKAALSQVPDDPGGLLRNKFLRDYQKQQQDNNSNE